MTKNTKAIQQELLDLGTKLGFISKTEYQFKNIQPYTPQYDIVWFLDLKKYNLDTIPFFQNSFKELLGKGNFLVPIVAIELENSDLTSKKQIGNIMNLYTSPAYFKLIVTTTATKNTEDMHRRAIRMFHSYSHLLGNRNLLVIEYENIEKIKLPNFTKKETLLSVAENQKKRKGAGGETSSKSYSNNLYKKLKKTSLEIKGDAQPEVYDWIYSTKNVKESKSKYFYIPKLDFMTGFSLPESFSKWLNLLANKLTKTECREFPLLHFLRENPNESIFFPLAGFEIETGNGKHLNGGITNLATHCFMGFLVSEFEEHLQTYQKHLGFNNVFFINQNNL